LAILLSSLVAAETYCIGDCLFVGMKPYLLSLLGSDSSGFSAVVGDGTVKAMSRASFDSQTTHALVGLGTNDFWDSQSAYHTVVVNAVTQMRSWSSGVEIFWVNIYAPRSDVAAAAPTINSAIQQVANSDPLFHVIDWYTYAKGNPTYTYSDQLHPAQTQTRANWIYAQMQAMATVPFAGGGTNTGSGTNSGGTNSGNASPNSMPVPDVLGPCQYKGVSGNCSTSAGCATGNQLWASSLGASGCEMLPAAYTCCVPPYAQNNQPTQLMSNTCSAPSAGISSGVCMSEDACTNGGLSWSNSGCDSDSVCCALVYCNPPAGEDMSSVMQCADVDYCNGVAGYAYASNEYTGSPSTTGNACAKNPLPNIQCCVFPDSFVSSVSGFTSSSFLAAQPVILASATSAAAPIVIRLGVMIAAAATML